MKARIDERLIEEANDVVSEERAALMVEAAEFIRLLIKENRRMYDALERIREIANIHG